MPALASTSEPVDKQEAYSEDPFGSPSSVTYPSPTLPKPCAEAPSNPRYPVAIERAVRTSHKYHQYRSSQSHKPGSLSSNCDSDISTPVSSMDLEKASARPHGPQRSSRDSRRGNSRDPEKMPSNHDRNDSHQSRDMRVATSITYEEDDDEIDEARGMQEKKAVKILLFMSGPCVLLSALNAAWVCIALVITLLSQPIRICAKRASFGQQLAGLLGPTLNLQLRCIHTPLAPYANEDGSYHPFMLVVVHVLSPFLSFAMMFAAWTLAVYWASSAVVGDPAGLDKRDDGKETVLGLRRWWERWLLRGVKEE